MGEGAESHDGFRYNSSTPGRFLTPDLAKDFVTDPPHPQSWNQYAYVMNNPTNWIDPNGLDTSACTVNGQPGFCSSVDAQAPNHLNNDIDWEPLSNSLRSMA